jgi:preprotein translocase subunit SecD
MFERNSFANLSSAVLTLVLGVASCESKPTAAEVATASPSRAIVEFAVVADAQQPAIPGSRTVEYLGRSYTIEPPRHFSIQRAEVAPDSNGYSAVAFELAASEQSSFREWTAAHVGRFMVALVDGEVVMMAKINSALPGAGIIESGAQPWTDEQARDLAARIAPPK